MAAIGDAKASSTPRGHSEPPQDTQPREHRYDRKRAVSEPPTDTLLKAFPKFVDDDDDDTDLLRRSSGGHDSTYSVYDLRPSGSTPAMTRQRRGNEPLLSGLKPPTRGKKASTHDDESQEKKL